MPSLENVFSGESAASRVAYAYSEAILIVQNTKEKSSFFAGIEDLIQKQAVNVAGIVPEVVVIPSNSDIAAAYRNLSTKYSRVSLYTSSSNLLRLIPFLYQLSSEQTPAVIHVAAESSESLGASPFGDYSDLMAVRDTGVAMLGSHTVQDCYNLSVVAYRSSLKSKTPFIHFFDGQHLSHKNAVIDQLTDDTLGSLSELAIEPVTAIEPTNEESESAAESVEAGSPFKNYAVSRRVGNQKDILESVTQIMTSLETTFKKLYSPITYSGNAEAELVIVALGASVSVVEDALIKLSVQEKFGLVKVYLFRPWAEVDFLGLIPQNVKKIAVLEQSSDSSNIWGPLFLDTTTCFQSTQWLTSSPHIISGHYGGPLRNFAPEMVNDLVDTLQSNDSEIYFQLGSKQQNGLPKETLPEAQQPSWVNVPENAAELPYLKLLSHLFGERLKVVNASRSTSVWSPTSALPTNNPEFGFGVIVADIQKRTRLAEKIATLLKDNSIAISEELHIALSKWVLQRNDPTESKNAAESLSILLEAEHNKHAILEEVYKFQQSHQLQKPARWLVGSDEWAFDLGNSGVHHVISSGENVNMLVVDTTPYTERDRWVAEKRKKDIGLYAMNYGKVYVASVAVYSSYTQVLHALMEAEAFDGPSVVLAYMPINSEEGERGRNPITVLKETKLAVDTGYWPLYRWNPSLEAKGLESFILDSEKIKADLQKFLSRENQLNILANAKPELAKSLESSVEHEIRERHTSLVKEAKSAFSKLLNGLNGPPLLILVASDGGNAATLAKRLDRNAKCRGMNSRILSMDEFPAEDLGLETNVIFIISTAGQGEFPTNGRDFWKVLSSTDLALKDTNFSVFGLGDSHYWPRPEDHIYYNKPAKDVNNRLFELGAVRFAPLGLGDDQDADGFETGYKEWEPKLWEALGVDIIEGAGPAEEPTITDDQMKTGSNFLRGSIAEGLADTTTGALCESDTKLTKFHGIYQQDDRDLREERHKQGLEKAYSFMVRVRLPGGIATPEQWLAMDDIATNLANGTLKLTTRQTFQLHGVLKRNLKSSIRDINTALMDTLAACGDVNRNVMCCPNPDSTPIHREVFEFSKNLSEHLLPRTSAYHEIWLSDNVVGGNAIQDYEPLYGPTYLPRKFKVAVAVPPSNDVDVFAHCLGYIAIVENDKLVGYNVTVGGGMGMTHNNKKTFPRIAEVMGFCTPEQAIEVGEKVMLVQRDYGVRTNRKHARLKYTIDDRGLDWFRGEVEERLGYKLEPARAYEFAHNGDRYGWRKDDNGTWQFGMYLENGRIKDTPDFMWKTGLREIAKVHKGSFLITPNQNLTLAGVTDEDLPKMKELLRQYKLDNVDHSGLRLSSMACVALPTCGLAMAESERYLPSLITKIDQVIEEAGLRDDAITIRMTGCPNGCARPYVAEIAFVGKAPGTYNLYLGGGHAGQRLNKLYKESIQEEEIIQELTPLIKHYALEREDGEKFGDFVIRKKYIKATIQGGDFHDL